MDKIFGENNFRNEIVWCYTGASSPGQKQFPRKHDTIFWYSKDKDWVFNEDAIRMPYSVATLQRAKAGAKGGRSSESVFHGIRTKRILDDKGKLPEDWWEIPPVGSTAKERLGYPTQKPEALLEKIIKTASNKKDIILDPMAGGGTTIAVAHKLRRKWIGIDISPMACKMMVERMRKLGVIPLKVIGMPKTVKEIKELQPFVFQNWVCEQLLAHPSRKKVGDMGIDGWMMDGRPLQVKQSEHIGRNVIDNFETAIQRMKKTKGVIVALSFGKGAYEEVARAKNQMGLDIELKTVEDILGEE
jgi:hypothetical protein